jgi:two-component system, cell cycle response regulator DivK
VEPDAIAPLVLIVEDYPDAREMYAAYLTLSGFRVAEASNGLEAVARATERGPDLIVMDLALPILDGWEAARRLKADPRTARIPILALSGHTRPTLVEEARAAGCARVLLKPCLPDQLVAEIRAVLSGS